METNIGNIDRLIRLIIGVVLLIIAFASHLTSGLWSYAAIGFGMAFFGTAVVGFCPFYALFGLNTCKF